MPIILSTNLLVRNMNIDITKNWLITAEKYLENNDLDMAGAVFFLAGKEFEKSGNTDEAISAYNRSAEAYEKDSRKDRMKESLEAAKRLKKKVVLN